jgi:hypothetical protein
MVFDMAKLQQIKAAAAQKLAFVPPPGGDAPMGDPMMAVPPGGAPPMDPAAMGGAPPMDPAMMGGAPPMDPAMMDPSMMGGAPPMDPAAMGGMPPMDPAMMGGAPPMDPSMQAMGDQEGMKSAIRSVLQEMGIGGENAGQGVAAPKKSGSKVDEAIGTLRTEMLDQMKEQQKILVAALRNANIDISLADMYGIEKGPEQDPQQQQQAPEMQQAAPGTSENMEPGMGSASPLGSSGKVASMQFNERDNQDIQALTTLLRAKDSLKNSAMKLASYPKASPVAPELDYFAGLFR